MNEKTLSIVIPVFNKFNFTKSCLEDLYKLPENHEIIVIDNGSTDETQEQLKDNKRIIYIRNSVNEGFAKACNKGFSICQSRNLMFLNNDIRVKDNYSNWTKEIIEYCNLAWCGCKEQCLCERIDYLIGPTMGQLDKNLNFVKEANKVLGGNSYISGWCIAASRAVWSKLYFYRKSDAMKTYCVPPPAQIFSEEFGLAYFEDTDLSFRARKLGIEFKIVDIPVVHFGKQTSVQLNTHKLYTEARKIFVKKWSNKL